MNAMTRKDSPLKEQAQSVITKLTIVTAESCTAGAVASLLSQAEGAGDVLHGGFITYTKAHKCKALGVSERVLKEQGAVNEEVAKQLAQGALERSAIAVSGVLGPEPDKDGNSVGLVYFCTLVTGGEPKVAKEEFGKKPHDQLLEQALRRACGLIEATLTAPSRKHAK